MSCGTMGQSHPIVRTTDQSKARQLGGETKFFSTHELIACTAGVAHPGNLAALKPPLFEAKWDLDIFYIRGHFLLCHVMMFLHGTIVSNVLVVTWLQQWWDASHNKLVWKVAKQITAWGRLVLCSLWEGLGSRQLDSKWLAFSVPSMTCCLGNLCATF